MECFDNNFRSKKFCREQNHVANHFQPPDLENYCFLEVKSDRTLETNHEKFHEQIKFFEFVMCCLGVTLGSFKMCLGVFESAGDTHEMFKSG